MKEIWYGATRDGPKQHFEALRGLQREHDQAVIALFTPEQKAAYDKLVEDYAQKVRAVERDRERAFQVAVEQTKAMLDETQRKKYDELMTRRRGERGGRGDRGDAMRGPPPMSPFGGPPPDKHDGPGGPGRRPPSSQSEK